MRTPLAVLAGPATYKTRAAGLSIMRPWTGVAVAFALANAGCIYSNENGDWDARPVHHWKCQDTGLHGFVLDTDSRPLAAVFVSFRPFENGDIEEAVDTDHSGAWEVCKAWQSGATITFEKNGYATAVLRPQEYPDQHEFEIVLPPA